ncbi:MAG TPA: hypothetical protein ENN76_00275, partial [Euryarchaeota archaeon]|nr:hypothetical protein [Euryarchaeota archaeon]
MPKDSVNQGSSPDSDIARKKRGLPLRGALARRDTWIGQNWKAILAVILVFALALFVRSYFGFDSATNDGDDFLLSGGSDAYYYKRIIDFTAETGKDITFDPMLNYPLGTRNPRPPLYGWSNVFAGQAIAPILGMDDHTSIWYVFQMSTAFWGALTIVPLYFIGREIFDKRTAIVAAITLALMAAHIDRSVLSNGDHDAYVLFFVTCAFYFYLRALNTVKGDRWVENLLKPASLKAGLKKYFSSNKRSLLYAFLSAMFMLCVSLAWQGFIYIIVVVLIYLVIQLFFNMFRKKDSLAVLSIFAVSIGIFLIFSGPHYVLNNLVRQWYDQPVILYFTALFFGALFVASRDIPWIVSLPAILIIAGLTFSGVYLIDPELAITIASGAGYVIQTKAYETIAEAQAPDFSRLGMAFGLLTFYLSIAGMFMLIYRMRKEGSTGYTFIVAWASANIILSLSAARFMFTAAPAFALTSAWVLVIIYEKMGFEKIIRTFRKFEGSPFKALKKSVKISQIAVLLVFLSLVVVPNAWFAVDAGIPYEDKSDYDEKIQDTVPDFFKSDRQEEAGNWYFGAFGYSLPKKTSYYPAAYQWLATQDTDIVKEEDRPAFISWWDYGFEVVQEGKHPTVADNFLGGHRLAGNFLMSQSESESIALLVVRILEGDYKHGNGELSPGVKEVLVNNGLNPSKVEDVFGSGDRYVSEVKNNPDIYGPMDQDRLLEQNAQYAMLRVYVVTMGTTQDVVNLYADLEKETGHVIRYAAVDRRLFPFSAMDTGIFYAPAKLSDRRMNDDTNTPIDFYEVKVVGIYGDEYTFDDIPNNFQFSHYKLAYTEMFFNTMLYKIYIGYSGIDIGKGLDAGIPGINGDLQEEMAMPGWMMTHYRMVYRTAYWNPYEMEKLQDHTDAWTAINLEDAYDKAVAGEGVSDLTDRSGLFNPGGVVMLKYYHGAILSGQVTLEDDTPYPGLYVTVREDGLGSGFPQTPKQRVETDENGMFEVILPFGDCEVVVSRGTLDRKTQVGSDIIDSKSFFITDEQAMRVNVDRDRDGVVDYLLTHNFSVKGGSVDGVAFWDINGNGNFDKDTDEVIPNATVTLLYAAGEDIHLVCDENGYFKATNVLPGSYRFAVTHQGTVLEKADRIEVAAGASQSKNVGVKPSNITVDVNIPGTTVYLSIDRAGEIIQATANAMGKAVFNRLMPGNYTISAVHGEMTFKPLLVVVGEDVTKEIDATLEKTVSFSGSTLISGKRTPGVSIVLWKKDTPDGFHQLFSDRDG